MHNITAFYSGDSNNPSGTSAVVVVTVAPATTYLSANCGSAFFAYGGTYSCNVNVGSTAGGAQGVITYSVDGGAPVPVALSGGGASFSLSGLNAAQHTVSICYAAQGNFAAAGPSAQNFTVTQLPTQVQLTPTNYYPSAGSSLTLTATMSTYSFRALSGRTAYFLDNGTLIGTHLRPYWIGATNNSGPLYKSGKTASSRPKTGLQNPKSSKQTVCRNHRKPFLWLVSSAR